MTLACPREKKNHLTRLGKPRCGKRDTLGWRLGGMSDGDGGSRWLAIPGVAGKQAGSMAILAHSQQHQVEPPYPGQFSAVGSGTFRSTKLGRDDVDLRGRNRHMVKQRPGRHQAVAFAVARRQAALVAIPDMPMLPVAPGASQPLINSMWCGASGQHDVKAPTLRNRLGCGLQYGLCCGCLQLGSGGERTPAAYLNCAHLPNAAQSDRI